MRAVWLIVLAGCGRFGFDPTGAPSDGAGMSDGDAAFDPWQHRPAACVLAHDTTFDTFPPTGWNLQGTVDTTVDTSAPYSKTVARWSYPIGFPGTGFAPGKLDYGPPELSDIALRELYVGVVWKSSSPWQGHTSAFNTIFYIFQDNGSLTGHTLAMYGQAPPYHLASIYDGMYLVSNVDDVIVTLGVWHVIELHRVASSSATAADGIIEWWLDGTQLARYTDVRFVQAPLSSLSLDPSFGGADNVPKAEDDYYWMDRVTLCAR
jgi:hypothetical protein